MGLPATKRYLIELLHIYKLTYEQVADYAGIETGRVKEIKKGAEPSDEERVRLRQVAFKFSELRQKDTGETMD